MKKAKLKRAKADFDSVVKSVLRNKPEVPKDPDYAQIASDLRDSFLRKSFTTEQAFTLTALILSKGIY